MEAGVLEVCGCSGAPAGQTLLWCTTVVRHRVEGQVEVGQLKRDGSKMVRCDVFMYELLEFVRQCSGGTAHWVRGMRL